MLIILSAELETLVKGCKFLKCCFVAKRWALQGCFNLDTYKLEYLQSLISSNSLVIAISQQQMQCKATFQRPILSLNATHFFPQIYDRGEREHPFLFTGEKGKKKGKTLKLLNSKAFNRECSVRVLKEQLFIKILHSTEPRFVYSQNECFFVQRDSSLHLSFYPYCYQETIDMLFPNGNLS